MCPITTVHVISGKISTGTRQTKIDINMRKKEMLNKKYKQLNLTFVKKYVSYKRKLDSVGPIYNRPSTN